VVRRANMDRGTAACVRGALTRRRRPAAGRRTAARTCAVTRGMVWGMAAGNGSAHQPAAQLTTTVKLADDASQLPPALHTVTATEQLVLAYGLNGSTSASGREGCKMGQVRIGSDSRTCFSTQKQLSRAQPHGDGAGHLKRRQCPQADEDVPLGSHEGTEANSRCEAPAANVNPGVGPTRDAVGGLVPGGHVSVPSRARGVWRWWVGETARSCIAHTRVRSLGMALSNEQRANACTWG
jgi:hypothetical protein